MGRKEGTAEGRGEIDGAAEGLVVGCLEGDVATVGASLNWENALVGTMVGSEDVTPQLGS